MPISHGLPCPKCSGPTDVQRTERRRKSIRRTRFCSVCQMKISTLEKVLTSSLSIAGVCVPVVDQLEALSEDENMSTALTTNEAAQLLKLQPATIRRWVAEGQLAAKRLPNGQLRIPRDEVARVLQSDSLPTISLKLRAI
jgi:excisionase family DNA binding protein